MALEIERKYLVINDSYLPMAVARKHMHQGYLSKGGATVRVRTANDKGYLTIKSRTHGFTRNEWEYEIPLADAQEMLAICDRSLEKYRYIVPFEGFTWEVDIFLGRHSGIAVAEIELPSENTHFTLPPFVGKEVTGDPYYYNSNLSAI